MAKHRVALISDLHGNALALDAVLRDIADHGADQTVCLGDTATLGVAPNEVLARLAELEVPSIEGNHDAFLLEPNLLRSYTDAALLIESIEWCRNELTQSALQFVRTFVPEMDVDLGGGCTLRLFHGTPRSHSEDLLVTTPLELVDEMLGEHPVTIMAGGHTHLQMLRQHRGILVVNPGSVGAPFKEFVDHGTPSLLPHAEYALLEANRGCVEVIFRRVALDSRALVNAVETSRCPLAPWLARQYGG